MYFRELSEKWLLQKKLEVKESTYYLYCYELKKYIFPILAETHTLKITEKNIGFVLDKIRQTELKRNTKNNLVALFSQIVNFGITNHILKVGCTVRVPLKKDFCKTTVFRLSDKDINKLEKILFFKPDNKKFGVMLALYMGLRIGEICALKWQNFDFENKTISIENTLQRCYANSMNQTKIVISSVKTVSSKRLVPIPEKLLEIALNLYTVDDYFMLSNSKNVIEPRNLRRFYMNLCKNNKINGLHFHSLRHTFASKCVESGENYKTISELLGHANINTTLNLYVHPTIEEKRKCIEKLFKI